jgi:aminoglycoside phosphotransferase family enzyme/predicted kinase
VSTSAGAFLAGLAEDGVRETHISRVFLGRDTVWKLKKPVRLSFLDFSSLAARHRFLLRELALNGPAAPGLYRDVVAVVRRADGSVGFADPAEGEVLDWVLRMARVPEQDLFESLLARGGLTPALLDRTADMVAAYHAALPPAGPGRPMARIVDNTATAAREAGLADPAIAAWREGMAAALAARAGWAEARLSHGFVRRGHADLHLGNLCLWHGAPVPFDALEFDEALATTDIGYDLAFLLMDLEVRLHRAGANQVLNRYVARTGDAGLVAGLPPFLSLRAMIRAAVQATRGADPAAYLDMAQRCLRPAPPVLVAVGGLQGSGKSTLAKALAPALGAAPGALVLRSDEIRKRLHGAAPEQRLPQAAYAPAANRQVNRTLLEDAARALEGGHAVIADATFLDAAQRQEAANLAAASAVPFVGLWLHAPLAVLEARLAARQGDASDATADVLRRSAVGGAPPGPPWVTIAAEDAARVRDAALASLRAAVPAC